VFRCYRTNPRQTPCMTRHSRKSSVGTCKKILGCSLSGVCKVLAQTSRCVWLVWPPCVTVGLKCQSKYHGFCLLIMPSNRHSFSLRFPFHHILCTSVIRNTAQADASCKLIIGCCVLRVFQVLPGVCWNMHHPVVGVCQKLILKHVSWRNFVLEFFSVR
jgi:hypothetical protein